MTDTFTFSIERADLTVKIPADGGRFGPMTDKERREQAMLLADRDDTIKSIAIMSKGKIVDIYAFGEWG